MKLELTSRYVYDLLSQAVDLKGADHVDPHSGNHASSGCRNIIRDHDKKVIGRCLISQVLSFAGVSDEDLDLGNSGVNTTLLELAKSYPVEISPRALTMFAVAQRAQDRGTPWGACHSIAGTVYHDLGYISDDLVPVQELLK